jgi:hypothetical protein
VYGPYEQGVFDERNRCCRALCPYCAAAQGSGRTDEGARVAAVRQRGTRFVHEVSPLQGPTREEDCRAACLLTVH